MFKTDLWLLSRLCSMTRPPILSDNQLGDDGLFCGQCIGTMGESQPTVSGCVNLMR